MVKLLAELLKYLTRKVVGIKAFGNNWTITETEVYK